MINRPSHQHAFTLVELLLAITILGIVMTITYSSLTSILRMKTILEERREIRQEANAILVRIARELQIATTSSPILPPENSLKEIPAGNLNLVGESEESSGKRQDSIKYVAHEAGQFMPGGERNSGLVQISYFVLETPDEYKRGNEETWSLVREEIPRTRPYEDAYKKSIRFPLSYHLTRFRIDYYQHSSKNWFTEWGNNDNYRGLPDIIRLTVGFLSSSGREEVYTTSVALTGGKQ